METNKSSNLEDPHQSETTNVLSMPIIVQDKILGSLSHTEKLISRLVCKDWDIQVSSILAKTSYFVLNSREGNQILLDSNVQWTKLKITGTFLLSQQFKNCITSLQLDFSGFPKFVTTWKKLLLEFPNVTNLLLNFDGRNTKSESQVEVEKTITPNLTKIFKRIVERLVSLTISFPFNDFTYLEECLCEFISGKMSLCKLSIRESSSSKPEKPFSGKLFSHIFAIVSWSCRSLKYLELDLYSEGIRSELAHDLITHLCKLDNLKLKSVLIRYVPIVKNIDRDFSILSKFLMTQTGSGVLKSIVLPWTSNAVLCQEFIRSIPPDIESIGNLRSEHFTEEFPTGFKKLMAVSTPGNIGRALVSGKSFDIQNLEIIYLPINIGGIKIFSDLTELIISRFYSAFTSFNIQAIIRNLKKLQVLHIHSSDITDFEVTGLKESDAMELQLTKRLYFDHQINPSSYLPHERLSSLRKLEKLILVSTKITDVGLVLGFQFGSSLKHLTIGSDSNEVSDMGLHFIVANNSGLESFHGLFKSPKISTVGIASLKKQFPMIKYTQKFAVINATPEVVIET